MYERPANLFVADFMGLVNKVEGQLEGRDGDTLCVRVGVQSLLAQAHGPAMATTGPVILAIRPEAIRLGAEPGAVACNVITGNVIDSTFLGNIVEHRIDIGGAVLRVQAGRWVFHAPGERVVLSIPVEECLAVGGEA